MNKGYGDAGASWHKKATKGFRAMSGSPKEDIDANNYTLRQRARMLYMAAPIATSAIRTNRTNVVGIGLQLKSRIDREALGMTQEAADAWQAQAEREFALWSENKGRATPPASTTSQPCSSSLYPRGWSAATCSPS
ncbi:phage portal protein [Faecalibacterium taiwanense]|uniref:phage portal protein n=1 Tax=Faecalibacterium taiwanense TaxID=3030638 RepID=UPI00321AD040